MGIRIVYAPQIVYTGQRGANYQQLNQLDHNIHIDSNNGTWNYEYYYNRVAHFLTDWFIQDIGEHIHLCV